MRGTELQISSELRWNVPDSCPTREAPPIAYAYCATPALSAQTYTVSFGESVTFDVGGSNATEPCVSNDTP